MMPMPSHGDVAGTGAVHPRCDAVAGDTKVARGWWSLATGSVVWGSCASVCHKVANLASEMAWHKASLSLRQLAECYVVAVFVAAVGCGAIAKQALLWPLGVSSELGLLWP